VTVTVRVPRRLQWHVTTRIAPEDQPAYWVIYWHAGKYFNGYWHLRITVALTIALLMGFAVYTQSLPSMLTAYIGWVVLTRMQRSRLSVHLRAMESIYQRDEKKWRAINQEATKVCEACGPKDPTVDVTITLPD
jgi:hypothetical protein